MTNHDQRRPVGRRRFLLGAGAATAAVATTTVTAGPAGASPVSARTTASPLPKPIPGGFDTGVPSVGFINFFLPGPPGSVTPVLGLPGGGLDVESSTITDFHGTTAFAVLAGEATASDGGTYPFEFDVRVMEGTYVAESGEERKAAFAFL